MKIELHTHSKEISTCGHLSVEELIELYKAGKSLEDVRKDAEAIVKAVL